MQILAVAVGGAAGALSRYWVSTWVYARLGTDFPYGTLVVNVAGSLLMGFFYILLLERMDLGPGWRGLITVGFLGAFTTFSTFSIETLNLLEIREYGRAIFNVLASVIFCIAAAWLGLTIGRQI